MKTIILASQKGGSGKTTLTAALSVEAERAGDGPCYLLDTDGQGTLTQWHERRESDTPQRVDVPLSKIDSALATIESRGASYAFIDTAPATSPANTRLIGLADLVVIPVRPSPADLWAVSETVQTVKQAGRAFVFVITQAKPQASITAQAIAALSEHGRVAQAFIADRVAHATAMVGGRTAPEQTKGPAGAEIAALWTSIKSCFHEKVK